MSPPKKEPVPGKNGRYAPLELKLAVVKAFLARQGTARELSEVYGITRKCVYEWARRYQENGESGLERRSRKSAPHEPTPAEKQIAQEIVEAKKAFGWFGVPRITQWLRRAKLLPVTEHQVIKALKEADHVA